MAVSFVVAVTIPEAFHDLAGGLYGPLVFAACYAMARVIHFTMFWACATASGDAGLRRQLLRSIPPWLLGTGLLVAAAFTGGWLQIGLWALALAIDLGGTLLNGMSGWRLYSAAHFAERHSLIIIVALGESIVAVGVGVVAFGLKKVLTYVADINEHSLTDPLHGVGLFSLYGGVALYLLGHVGLPNACWAWGRCNGWPRHSYSSC